MKKIETVEATVIDLKQTREESSWSRYFNILSFNEIISEVSQTISELDTTPLNSDLTLKSKVLFQELGSRVENQGSANPSFFEDMTKHLNRKIQEIQNIL